MGSYSAKAYWRRHEGFPIAAGLLVIVAFFVVEWLLPRDSFPLMVAEAAVAIALVFSVSRVWMATWKDVEVVSTADGVTVRLRADPRRVLLETAPAGLSARVRYVADSPDHVLYLSGPLGVLVLVGPDALPFSLDLEASGVPVTRPRWGP